MFSNVITHLSTTPIFLDFSVIFLPFYNLKSAYFLIWKCALDPENVSQHYHQQ